MSNVIELRDVSKSFEYWEERPSSVKKILADLLRGRVKMGHKRRINILEQVSFGIKAGEFVGIMGHNGAGKSTILKIVSGIYEPTAGEVKIGGKVSPLLELGAGFEDDLSGFDNIFLNAAILGFGLAKTKQNLRAIIEFSELGDAIHQPVRSYSSGMVIRLGFSIAVHFDAPILLFDEVLAVGDAAFQAKCLAKIDELHKAGRTIVLVTHIPEQVERYCSRCIVIGNHQKIFDGDPKEGVRKYYESVQENAQRKTHHTPKPVELK